MDFMITLRRNEQVSCHSCHSLGKKTRTSHVKILNQMMKCDNNLNTLDFITQQQNTKSEMTTSTTCTHTHTHTLTHTWGGWGRVWGWGVGQTTRTLTHTHTHCSDIWTDLSVQKCYWLHCISHCIWFRYAKLSTSTRWKKLILFSKDMVVVIYNHPSLSYHMSFI